VSLRAELALQLGHAVGFAALVYLMLHSQGTLQRAAGVGLVLVFVDWLATVGARLVRRPGYGWPYVVYVIAAALLSLVICGR
jgi:hypothetical protein